MAAFHGIILMVTLCIAHNAFMVTSKKTIEVAPAPYQKFIASPYQKFIAACEKRMTGECAYEVVEDLLQVKNVSDGCCVKLVNMGNDCHKELIRRLVLTSDYEEYKAEIESNNVRVWKRCSAIAPTSSAIDDAPRFPSIEELPKKWNYLKKCIRKMNEKCADQILDRIVEDKKITRECCIKLVHMGNNCHKILSEELIKATGISEAIVTQVESKSRRVWNECVKVAHSPSSPKAFT